MSQASLGLNPCFLYPTFELFDVLTWCPDMILTWYQKMFWAHWLILHIRLMRITTLLHCSKIHSSRSLSRSVSTLLCLMPEMLLHLKSYLQYNTTNLNTEHKYCFVILSWSDISHLDFVCLLCLILEQIQACNPPTDPL